MWWNEVSALGDVVGGHVDHLNRSAIIDAGASIELRGGPLSIGTGSRICAGATIIGPVVIGEDCLIGHRALIRGPAIISDRVTIGFSTEIKNSRIAADTKIGPMCFVADSIVDEGAYLGALVRTSNHRLDGKQVTVSQDGAIISSDMEKLGSWIGARTALGIQTVILPGRVVPPDSLFGPGLIIDRNHPKGHYRRAQTIETF